MSQILVIVPPEWTRIDVDAMCSISGDTLATLSEMQGHTPNDLNDKLAAAGWFADERRIADLMVLDSTVYLRLE